ncbi:hypothetical protein BIW11_02420 [Tropilaelaps mercedesae]|uniref:Uncharacterized protein n=1 Tax=Tropilaelaps mercedesae TaxID=418985 RepID=A0A1V9Y3V4_9ACAR|nr:hypothetical protein BIW11_02420 [Tropilaelaps mercedesae]
MCSLLDFVHDVRPQSTASTRCKSAPSRFPDGPIAGDRNDSSTFRPIPPPTFLSRSAHLAGAWLLPPVGAPPTVRIIDPVGFGPVCAVRADVHTNYNAGSTSGKEPRQVAADSSTNTTVDGRFCVWTSPAREFMRATLSG